VDVLPTGGEFYHYVVANHNPHDYYLEDVTVSADKRKHYDEMSDHDLLVTLNVKMEQFDPQKCTRHEERIRQIFGVGVGAWALILVLAGVLLRMALG
jgi:hypothetical protein